MFNQLKYRMLQAMPKAARRLMVGVGAMSAIGAMTGTAMAQDAPVIEAEIPNVVGQNLPERIVKNPETGIKYRVTAESTRIFFGNNERTLENNTAGNDFADIDRVLPKIEAAFMNGETLVLGAFASARGNYDYNLNIADARARAVKGYLLSKLDPTGAKGYADKIDIQAFGEQGAKTTYGDETSAANDRRVEFFLSSNVRIIADAPELAPAVSPVILKMHEDDNAQWFTVEKKNFGDCSKNSISINDEDGTVKTVNQANPHITLSDGNQVGYHNGDYYVVPNQDQNPDEADVYTGTISVVNQSDCRPASGTSEFNLRIENVDYKAPEPSAGYSAPAYAEPAPAAPVYVEPEPIQPFEIHDVKAPGIFSVGAEIGYLAVSQADPTVTGLRGTGGLETFATQELLEESAEQYIDPLPNGGSNGVYGRLDANLDLSGPNTTGASIVGAVQANQFNDQFGEKQTDVLLTLGGQYDGKLGSKVKTNGNATSTTFFARAEADVLELGKGFQGAAGIEKNWLNGKSGGVFTVGAVIGAGTNSVGADREFTQSGVVQSGLGSAFGVERDVSASGKYGYWTAGARASYTFGKKAKASDYKAPVVGYQHMTADEKCAAEKQWGYGVSQFCAGSFSDASTNAAPTANQIAAAEKLHKDVVNRSIALHTAAKQNGPSPRF